MPKEKSMRRHNKIRHTFYALAILCAAMPVARAGPTGPVILGPAEMDAVTAGGATGDAFAIAVGPFGFTGTSAQAINTMTTLNGNPALAGYAAGSEAVGSATASGAGGAVGTAAMTTAMVPGTQVITYTITGGLQVGSVATSGSATMSFGSFTGL
ncbi:MAG: hypothetical protein ACM3KD_06795 [Hyphomicrobiaceae bacterium]